jgi:hypothetical protein
LKNQQRAATAAAVDWGTQTCCYSLLKHAQVSAVIMKTMCLTSTFTMYVVR